MRFILLTLFLMVFLPHNTGAEALLPCDERPTALDTLAINPDLYCLEQVISDESGGEMGFTALASAPDGTLYATRPHTGEVFALTDSDGDLLPDTAQVIASGLVLPNALTVHDDVLYIAAGHAVHRMKEGQLDTIIDDLPVGGGFWTGGIAIGSDERLYVGIGSNCDACVPDEDRGVILSFTLDGEDRQVVAKGLRQPAGLVWLNEGLWAVDSAANTPSKPVGDEINLITPGGHYGFPHCYGRNNRPYNPQDEFDCENVVPPHREFPPFSNPLAIVYYNSNTLPTLNNTFVVALGGSSNSGQVNGYSIVSMRLTRNGRPRGARMLIPYNNGFRAASPADVFEGRGFFPHHVYGLTISPEGWLYISSGGSQIYALRPRNAP